MARGSGNRMRGPAADGRVRTEFGRSVTSCMFVWRCGAFRH
ncbi:hypothetical protein XOC_2043 [Xanthomonas oryzae pv. oryzicola BLS256]|uniref:Uncharacterized protein n=1 Tax=Xanthomonas oryzae pv. oryzicola (strain BLS256) TaxID=383407 RepID=G7TCL3_XANOB|nr:hypothetical protein XOC_2043 [Xanthomonas oryzae pv. oryzicola BLS256]QEO97856.1 hypothetical protein XOCgx_2867 [Xanthomonas oryzae pv. oryzicola]